ncbi:unnamed protein product [Lota lota]
MSDHGNHDAPSILISSKPGNSSSDDLDHFLNVTAEDDLDGETVTMTTTITSTAGDRVKVHNSAPHPWVPTLRSDEEGSLLRATRHHHEDGAHGIYNDSGGGDVFRTILFLLFLEAK